MADRCQRRGGRARHRHVHALADPARFAAGLFLSAPRLAAVVWVNALIRRINAAGDFATVLHKGDGVAGSVVLVHRRGAETRAYQRLLGPAGAYEWRVGAAGAAVDGWLERQLNYDPDLWVVEVDTPKPARFIDETIVVD